MAQLLRATAVLAEDLGSVPSIQSPETGVARICAHTYTYINGK